MPTAVITGCNSGIGHCLAQILIKEGYDVWATDVQEGEKLKGLGCKTAQLDVTSVDSIAAFKKSFGDQPLDVLLNIAGIMERSENDALETTNYAVLEKMFTINTYGPILLTQALLPNILKSSKPRIGVTSSRVGSMTDNSSGGFYAYRASKAAVNSLFKSVAVDLKPKGVVVTLLHPGFTKTNLDTSKKTHALKDAVEPEEAAEKLWRLVLSKEIDDTGKFWHREGMELPW